MVENFLYFVNSSKPPIKNLLFFPLDPEEERLLQGRVPTYYDGKMARFSSRAESFRRRPYNMIVKHKWQLVHSVLQHGYNVLLSDVDVVWFRNPFVLFETLPLCDLTVYCNDLHAKTFWTCVQFVNRGSTGINTGIMYFRSSPRTLEMVSLFLDFLSESSAALDDQTVFNKFFFHVLPNHPNFSQPQPPHHNSRFQRRKDEMKDDDEGFSDEDSFYPFHGTCAKLGSLTIGGMTSNDIICPKMLKLGKDNPLSIQPYAIHFNYLNGAKTKETEMKKLKLWFDKDALSREKEKVKLGRKRRLDYLLKRMNN